MFCVFNEKSFGPAVALLVYMILLIWSSERAQDCARAIEHAFQQPVLVAKSLREGCERLQVQEYTAVLLDQWITEAEPGQADYLFHHLGTAATVFVNFGISGIERIIREVRAAMNWRGRETMLARHHARIELRTELKDDLTALLLSSGIALEEPGMSESAITRLRKIEEIANQIKNKLVVAEEAEDKAAAGA